MFHFYRYRRLPMSRKCANLTAVTTVTINETEVMKLGAYHGQVSTRSD